MIFDVLGWIGMILVLLAYLLLSTNKINNGIVYQTINFFAAVFMAIGLFPTEAWFSITLQVIWALIAVVSFIKIKREKQ